MRTEIMRRISYWNSYIEKKQGKLSTRRVNEIVAVINELYKELKELEVY